MNSPLKDILVNILTGLPIYIALSVGFFLAIVRWKETPTASMILVILAPAWFFIKVGLVFLYAFVPKMLDNMVYENIHNIYRGLNCGASLIEGLAIGLLIWAIFAPRPAAGPKNPQAMP